MKIKVFWAMLLSLTCLAIPVTGTAQAVAIPDANLRAAIEFALGRKALGHPISQDELGELASLYALGANISDLTGLGGATNLTELNLGVNSVSDISALAGLTNLTWLNLSGNSVSDISALAGLTNLTRLGLVRNSVSDISVLAGLTNLTWLSLGENSVSDISALAGLTNLTELDLDRNSVSDISALAGLTNLTELDLADNSVSDISALAGLTNLTALDLGWNSVSDISALAGLTNLTQLSFHHNSVPDISALAGLTNLTWLVLDYNSVSDISALAGLTNLTWLVLAVNSVSDISALAGLTNLTTLLLDYNSVSDISALAGLTNLTWLGLSNNPLSYPSIHTHIPTLQGRGVPVAFDSRDPATLHNISGELTASDNVMIVEVRDGNDLPFEGVPVTFSVTSGGGTLSVTDTTTDKEGRAQSQLNFGSDGTPNRVEVSAAGIEERLTFEAISDTEPPPVAADVNDDESVNILDLVFVASRLGEQGVDLAADVNGDGVVNILDLVAVAGMFGDAAAAPSLQSQALGALNAADVRRWLTEAASLAVTDAIMKRGIVTLERLAASLKPAETALLANYPNPFNPETWIPYRLAEDAVVTLTIYDANGQAVRRLDLGHRTAAVYERQSNAIYWDGRNEHGEQVTSGVYFYQLSAGDYSATRKMVILK